MSWSEAHVSWLQADLAEMNRKEMPGELHERVLYLSSLVLMGKGRAAAGE